MAGHIDKDVNIAVVVPVSPQEFAGFCRTAIQELKPTRGIRPKCAPSSDRHIEEICRGMEINRKILEEEMK